MWANTQDRIEAKKREREDRLYKSWCSWTRFYPSGFCLASFLCLYLYFFLMKAQVDLAKAKAEIESLQKKLADLV